MIQSKVHTYRLQEAEIKIPDNWKDQTINVFLLPANETEGELSFVITRESHNRTDSIAQFTAIQIERLSKQLKGFRLLGQKSDVIGGVPTVVLDYQWVIAGEVTLCQRQGYIKCGDHYLILTLTTKKEQFDKYKSVWSEVTQTLQFRTS